MQVIVIASPALICPGCLLCPDIWCHGRLSVLLPDTQAVRKTCGRGQCWTNRLFFLRHLCLPAIVRSFCVEMKRKEWFMCAVTTTSVFAAVAPMLFFILWNRLKPRGSDSASLFICGNSYQKRLIENLREFMQGLLNDYLTTCTNTGCFKQTCYFCQFYLVY